MISFGPGGNSDSFAKKKFPEDAPAYLAGFGLNGYEIECGRGVRIGAKTYELLPGLAAEHGLVISLHAPYFISLSGQNEETRLKSIDYILEAAVAADKLGVRKIVVHSGSCAKMTRGEALALATDTLSRAQRRLDEEGLSEIILCPETMGKINQLGTLTEVMALCGVDERFLPCVDFGHLNARTLGGIKTREDYEAIFDEITGAIGFERTRDMHIHFSKIEYTAGGEKTHLTFADERFGPDYRPLIEVIKARGLMPSIICESQGTQAEDAAEMKSYYEKLF